MVSSEFIKYLALQLLVLAGTLNDEASKSGTPLIPLAFVKSLAPTNIQALIADAEKRIQGLSVVPLSANAAAQAPAAAPAVPHLQPAAVAAVPTAAVPAKIAPAAPPPANRPAPAPTAAAHVAPAPAPKGRRKRDVSDVLSKVADVVADVSSAVGDSPLAAVPGVGAYAQVIETASQALEDATASDAPVAPEATDESSEPDASSPLGDLILSA